MPSSPDRPKRVMSSVTGCGGLWDCRIGVVADVLSRFAAQSASLDAHIVCTGSFEPEQRARLVPTARVVLERLADRLRILEGSGVLALRCDDLGDGLVRALDGVGWPDVVKADQREALGGSHGARVRFPGDGAPHPRGTRQWAGEPGGLVRCTHTTARTMSAVPQACGTGTCIDGHCPL